MLAIAKYVDYGRDRLQRGADSMELTLGGMYAEHETVHYPELFKYVMMIAHENEEDGSESIGSGVLVGWEGRHLIATAAHCIRRNPRVMRECDFYLRTDGRMGTSPPVRILAKWLHPQLDIGFLEVDEALNAEMGEDQLFCEKVQSGPLHIIGHPTCRIETNEQLKEKTSVKSVFSTEIIEQGDDSVKLHYPVIGYRVEGEQWVSRPFIETPHGFSGGGCFGITSQSAELRTIGYKLVGIQSSWHRGERWVEVVPIRHWVESVKSQFSNRAESEQP
jgi:Trypsin-like peptidase domain